MKPPSNFYWDCTEKISGRKPGMKMKRRLAGSSLALINTRREFLCRWYHWTNCYSSGLGSGWGRLRVLSWLEVHVSTSRTGHRIEMEDKRWKFKINCRTTLYTAVLDFIQADVLLTACLVSTCWRRSVTEREKIKIKN